jgi:hypothetical protein
MFGMPMDSTELVTFSVRPNVVEGNRRHLQLWNKVPGTMFRLNTDPTNSVYGVFLGNLEVMT